MEKINSIDEYIVNGYRIQFQVNHERHSCEIYVFDKDNYLVTSFGGRYAALQICSAVLKVLEHYDTSAKKTV